MLYDASVEKDNCGFGLIAHEKGKASHRLIRLSIAALARMQHRGGIGADQKTGDGCGLQMKLPETFLRTIAEEQGWHLHRKFAVGMLFLSQDPIKAQQLRTLVEQKLKRQMLTVVGWREVPVVAEVLGVFARQSLPRVEQVFINAPLGWSKTDIERRLYILRRQIEKEIQDDEFYVASLSSRVLVYKGLCMPADLPRFYLDLADIRLTSSIVIFHQRFSTNTVPKWHLVQPFRYLAHNGEINTISSNREWARARTYKFISPLLPDMQDAAPFVDEAGSDSSSLDNMLELLLAGGMDLFRAMRLLIPPAWQHHPLMDADLRAFYDFNSMYMEPWDGPAGIVMSDGRYAACGLDRNGLRPARYVRTQDGLITLGSEVGLWEYAPDEVLAKGRVGPGEMLVVDTYTGKIWRNFEIDDELKIQHPYREWMEENCLGLKPISQFDDNALLPDAIAPEQLCIYQKMFGYSLEDLQLQLQVMAETGQEPTMAMGDDTPLAVLSDKPRSIYDYFRQKFAQVTNPAIDPLRESHVMSLNSRVGREINVFSETYSQSHRVQFETPALLPTDFAQLLRLGDDFYSTRIFTLHYDPVIGLEQALKNLTQVAIEAARQGAVILVFSDRDIGADKLVIPAPLAVGAVQQLLVAQQLRCDTNILVETATVLNSHHLAVLLGFGATAVYPYLAFDLLAERIRTQQYQGSLRESFDHYQSALNKGLLKVMSKMGISTVSSYRCSRLFDLIGIHKEVLELCFPLVPPRIEGVGFVEIEQQQRYLTEQAYSMAAIPLGGMLRAQHGQEYHCFNPEIVSSLQRAVQNGEYRDYQIFQTLVNQRPLAQIRDLIELCPAGETLTLDEVQSTQSLYGCFDTAAMSIGALSPEAHQVLAIAMNRLGGRSNSGEGGEDTARFNSERNSKIKQIASGRFGVTPHYLMSAEVIQIKIAQGAKPGEGGQLPGHKVSVEIAKLRHSTPGVTLISPPPHHDIYSIEDLAQLIFDLKQLNPHALVSVKLVSEPGIGTIAAGVAKTYADLITVSGNDGGTGASPMTSVRYAGSPWELGLAEVHQSLVTNGLRHKIRLQVDGGLKTGLDVIKAAILGAESFGFGTAPMVAVGCRYLRICHLNNCAYGIATQDETLREKHFKGKVEGVMNYFHFVAQEVREWLAWLGVSELNQLIGRVELLKQLEILPKRLQRLDLSALLVKVDSQYPNYQCEDNPPFDEGSLNQRLIKHALPDIRARQAARYHFSISNTDRSVGARLAGEVVDRYGPQAMQATPLRFDFEGTAGQSFGVWLARGIDFYLTGDANDYVGKGLSGGKLVLRPHSGVRFDSERSMIMGNTCLYGATAGELYAAGRAGERFAVRNSGAIAVVEGVGDNGCEYMTGGVVVVLGQCGINFAAGMTGGVAYVMRPPESLSPRVNPEHVEILSLEALPKFQEHLRGLILAHVEQTSSLHGERVLSEFDRRYGEFSLIKPKSLSLDALLGHRDGISPVRAFDAQ